MSIFKKLLNPPKEYRPIPFWSWNEKLDTEETKRQIALMDEAGIGGYFMHARGGLQTEYMGEEWFDNITAGVKEGKKRGMGAWAYDENGWPSGFGNGAVNGLGLKYQQKYLRMEKAEGVKQTEHTICNNCGYHFYYDVNPFYVDTLDKDVIKVFIETIYKPYYDRFRGEITGIFTDEPQVSRNGIPWSFVLPDEYKKAYGEDLLPRLIELFKPVGDYETTRFRFWKLITNLFTNSFVKQIYEWCEAHDMKFTGHMVLEETLESQITSNGAVMPNYEYFHMPGMDWLCRYISQPLTQLQLCSVAHQLGKKQIMTETFALCGHNVSFSELRWILEWQMVRGVTLLCTHLQGYSLRGIRKRDYPPALFYQQPWWDKYKLFIDAMTRIGVLLTDGKVEFDTLLLHPQSTAWVCFDNGKNELLHEYHNKFIDTINTLERKHIPFHLGDETIMEKHARVEGNTLIIGTQRYKTIVLPPHKILFDNTKKLLEEFKSNGGVIITAEEAEDNPVINNPNITYTKRIFDDFDMHYFVNTTKEPQPSKISVGNERFNIDTGLTEPFSGEYTFAPMDSLIVFERKNEPKKLSLEGQWEIKESGCNAVTLDYCDYYFDGEPVEKHGHVSSIQTKACELRRQVNIKTVFEVAVEDVPHDVYLVCETPEIFKITINGKILDQEDCGYYADKSFRKLDIKGYLQKGENEIVMETDFVQSPRVYENIEKSKFFESEKNKLTYDMEIESIYLIGAFSVKTDGKFQRLEKGALRYDGDFVIADSKKSAELDNLTGQGYPFFAGSITLEKKFNLSDTNYKLAFDMKGINAVRVKVNGQDAGTVIWNATELDLSRLLKAGENTIEITLTNNLRNLLGPHHLKEGESYVVGPFSFFKEPCVWNGNPSGNWDDRYCFIEMGIK